METKDIFYCIKLINADGNRGWLFDSKEGIKIITGGFHTDITQFETDKAALDFIREKKLERRGVKAYVRTNQDIIKEAQIIENKAISPMVKPMFHLENKSNKKCFYDSKQEVYFFKEMGEFGYPVWDDEKKLIEFVRKCEFQEGMIFLIKNDKGTKTRKLIQVYGRKQGENGEPKHIQVEGEGWKEY